MTARIGIVGIGWWSAVNHLPVLADCEHAKVAAICDLAPERLRVAGDKFGVSARYMDVETMLRSERLDGVIVATPHHAHTKPAIAALAAGTHVLIEKPMATCSEDARAIAQAARLAERQVMVPTAFSFTRFTETAAGWVRAGRIGNVRHVVCQMGSALEDLFGGEPMRETQDHLFRPPASTWADPAHAGGYGWGQLSHALGWLLHVADIELQNVFCLDGKSKTGVDFYDAAVARATNGATLVLSGSSTVPKHRGLHLEIRIYGQDGVIAMDSETGRQRLELRRADGDDELFTAPPREFDYDGSLPVIAFAKLCAGLPTTNPADAENGRRVVETLDAMYRSAKSGKLEPTR
jgi:predicted dehydrogenase